MELRRENAMFLFLLTLINLPFCFRNCVLWENVNKDTDNERILII